MDIISIIFSPIFVFAAEVVNLISEGIKDSDFQTVSLAEDDLFDKTGSYLSDVSNPQFQVHTYERICKGYYIIDDNGISIQSTGYGDLASEYTYDIGLSKEMQKSSTTVETVTPDNIATDTIDITP